jgi:hypothetical protein
MGQYPRYSFGSCLCLIKINPESYDENAFGSVDVCPQFDELDSLESIRPQFDNRGKEP